MKKARVLAGWVLLAAPLFLASTAAIAQTCILSGGKFWCGPYVPGPFTVAACDETSSYTARSVAWCQAKGGTYQNGYCPGATPTDDGNVVQQSVQFANIIRSASCSVTSDTGYGATYTTSFCVPGGDVYQHGFLQKTNRRLTIQCDNGTAETISINKSRGFTCPAGYAQLYNGTSGWGCGRALECEDCPKGVGNPITPLTGVKVEIETDYRHASGLEFVRHYHSFRFYEPDTDTNGAHTEGRMGIVWRTNYDKRVVPIVPAHATIKHAISTPSGSVQYFDLNGVEQYNHGKPSGTLVEVAGVGYYYRLPDSTEFYGTDGRLRTISRSSGRVTTLTYSDGTAGANGGYIVDWDGNPTSRVLPANRLIRVTDSYGNALAFGSDDGGRIITVTVPGGGQYKYRYDHNDNLTTVTYPDTRVRRYRYNEAANMIGGASLPHALTGIEDENGDLFASFKYDTSGRAVSTERAGGTQQYQLAYGTSSTVVTDPLGTARTLGATPATDGVARFTGSSVQGGAGYGAGAKALAYDAGGSLESRTDFNDIKTCRGYLAGRNLESVRVEGVPAATGCAAVLAPGAALPAGSRKVTTEWHPRWALPTLVAEPLRRTAFAYNGHGGASCAPGAALIDDGNGASAPIAVLCSRTVQATSDADGSQGAGAAAVGTPREWTYTYNATGQVLSVNGPRTDVSDVATYTYDGQGNLATVTNAASHTTSITSYNPHGQPLTIVDANALTTTMTYDERQRLRSRSVGSELTSYDYDAAGQLVRVTLADGSYLGYTYDAAHRLTGMQDNQGNAIAYTLDPMGNRTQEQVFDPASQLAQVRSRVFDNLNRLFKDLGAQSQTTEYTYDGNGNVLTVKDPLNRTTVNQYDALNRLWQVTDPGLGVTQYTYNGLDALIQVKDPRNLVTGYTVDGLGNLTLQSSPDTGNTASTHDAAGNLLTQTDAKGQTTTYAYDALNRVTLITFHDGSKQAYAYDAVPNGVGRLTSITETDPADQQTGLIQYVYTPHGRVTSETRTVNGVSYVTSYTYDSAGRLETLTYPSGRAITHLFDPVGRTAAITTSKASQSQVVVSNVVYHPFGGVKSFTLGNGQNYVRGYDQDGRISSYSLGAALYAVGYDAASRIEFISEVTNPTNINTYGYDALDRLTSAATPGTPFAYSYDEVGNRLSRTVGSATETLTYSTTSNRIASLTPASGPPRSFVFDANGSTTADGVNTYTYDTRGRMSEASSALGTTSYRVNALGQRVRKTNSQGDTVFHYDTGGRLIAESDASGVLKREYLYLGDMPVAVVVQ